MDGGRILIGGAPLRVLRLSPAGSALLDRLAAGEPVPAGPGAGALARRLLDAGLAHPRHSPGRGGRQGGGADRAGAGPGPGAVTLVVPVRDRSAGLVLTLASVGPVGAAIVVDDGSGPGEAAATARLVEGASVAAAGDGEMAVVAPGSRAHPLGPRPAAGAAGGAP
ncbi:MAG: hypothetical protein ACRD0L_12280, partial [Acidimicrobiales bacterium]